MISTKISRLGGWMANFSFTNPLLSTSHFQDNHWTSLLRTNSPFCWNLCTNHDVITRAITYGWTFLLRCSTNHRRIYMLIRILCNNYVCLDYKLNGTKESPVKGFLKTVLFWSKNYISKLKKKNPVDS